MDDIARVPRYSIILSLLVACCAPSVFAQNFERYKPLVPSGNPAGRSELPDAELPPISADDRILIDCLDAVIVVDDASKISLEESLDDLTDVQYRFVDGQSLACSDGVRQLIERHLNQPLSLRSINQMTRQIVKHYQRCGQPIVDVQIPEQRITGGTLQIVIVETTIDHVLIQPGCVFSCRELDRWIECTYPGSHVYEDDLKSDLFWLNQNPFRRVSVDFEPGENTGTTNVIYKSQDVEPVRGYLGGDDTGVKSLNYGRLFAGLMYGNLFNRGGLLSYQYTTDQNIQHLEAHSLSYRQPINRDYSLMTYGSWAGVSPMLSGGLSQRGESWQLGTALTRHLIRTADHSQHLQVGLDFKSTNNNLEFAGSTVAGSVADLVQLRVGVDDFERLDTDQYRSFQADIFLGPGEGMTGSHSTAAFNTIRPGTSPDYVYGRVSAEETSLVGGDWLLRSRIAAQASSERLLFSETLGLGGFDTIRGFDQRAANADHGWISNLEFGPRTTRWGDPDDIHSLRPYVFVDVGNSYISNPQPGDDSYIFAASSGVGLRFNVSDRLSLRFDWGYGWKGISGAERSNRAHISLSWIPGARP